MEETMQTKWLHEIEVDTYDLTNETLAERLEEDHGPLVVLYYTEPLDQGEHYLINHVEVAPLAHIEVDYSDFLYSDWVIDHVKEALAARGWSHPTYRVHHQETGAPFRYEWYGQRTEVLV